MYANNGLLSLGSSGCNYQHLYAADMGGLVYGIDILAFSLNSCYLQNITSGNLNLDSSFTTFDMTNSNSSIFKINSCKSKANNERNRQIYSDQN